MATSIATVSPKSESTISPATPGGNSPPARASLRSWRSLDQNSSENLDLIGFDDEELARLLADQDTAQGLTDEDAIPEVSESPVSVRGDLWLLGDHKLLVGDATVCEDVDRLMAGDRADLIFTDPPYNVQYEGYTEDRL